MPKFRRFTVLATAATLLASTAGSDRDALACDGCVGLGTSAFHVPSFGDSYNDALMPPHTGPTLNFRLQGGSFPRDANGRYTITYSFNNFLDGGLRDINGVSLPVSLVRASVEEAFGVWARHAPLHFVEVPDEGRIPTRVDYLDGQFGEIRFSHIPYDGADVPGQSPKPKALAYFRGSGGTNLSADIFFDNSDYWQEIGTLPQPDILGAAIHEIGHTLGLGHSSDPTANMYWIFRRFSGLGTGQLFADDIAGIQARYGAGLGSVTPLLQHAPEPGAALLWAIAIGWSMAQRCRQRRY